MLVDGAVVLTGVDPYALAGGKFTAVVRELTRTAAGANMVVSLQARVDNAALASLEVGAQKGEKKVVPTACVAARLHGACAALCSVCVLLALLFAEHHPLLCCHALHSCRCLTWV